MQNNSLILCELDEWLNDLNCDHDETSTIVVRNDAPGPVTPAKEQVIELFLRVLVFMVHRLEVPCGTGFDASMPDIPLQGPHAACWCNRRGGYWGVDVYDGDFQSVVRVHKYFGCD